MTGIYIHPEEAHYKIARERLDELFGTRLPAVTSDPDVRQCVLTPVRFVLKKRGESRLRQ
ncbi:MAG: hypothetical protein WEG56_09365 [Chloroflexota bacterium]